MSNTTIEVRTPCKTCAAYKNRTPFQDTTITWKANLQTSVSVTVFHEDCGHTYDREFKYKEWQYLLSQATQS